MSDRAKKISELQATTSVANTDKLVVLKDATNSSIASTRSITVNSIASVLKPLVQNIIPDTTVIANSITVASNGTNNVAFLSYTVEANKTGCCDITVHARDVTTDSTTAASILVVGNTSYVQKQETQVSVGTSTINFDVDPVLSSNVITLYFKRSDAATSNVLFKYSATIY